MKTTAERPKPSVTVANWDAIPQDLRRVQRWLNWRPQLSGDRWKKPPCDAAGKPIDPHDPKRWLHLEAAQKNIHSGGGRIGLGFSLGHDGIDDLVGIDFDHCIEGGQVRPDVLRIVRTLDSYTEITPSGDGLRVWVKGVIPAAGRRNDAEGIEIYAKDRYFTLTGQRLDGTPAGIHFRQEALDTLWRQTWPEADAKPKGQVNGQPKGRAADSDDELIERARRAKGGDKFRALFDDGDTRGYESPSSADMALMNILAFWTGRTAERMEAIFGRSALGQREKWTERADYRKQTVDQAIADCGNVYTPRTGRNGSAEPPSNGNGHHSAGRPLFANSIPEKQDGEVKHIPILMPELIGSLSKIGDGWPKRVDETLFIPSSDYRPIYLETSTQFFSWIDGMATIYWSRGAGMISQERLYEHVRKFVAQRFEAIESYPHEPPMPGNFYLHPAVKPRRRYDLTEKFLDFFHPATEEDRELIRAAILTTFWGGTPGARPAFRFDGPENDPPELGGRGVGKTKAVELIAATCGGLIDLREGESISDVITRLLSEEGRSKRVIRIDNVKTLRLSWADLEALITSKELSGKRLYRGEGRRPNVLTTFITVNGGSLSKDMATRQNNIRLARPERRGDWLRNAFGFIEEHRWPLIAEFLGALSDDPGQITPRSRWDEWEKEVLSRVNYWDRCQDVIARRAKELDGDDEDARELEEFIAGKLTEHKHNPTVQRIIIPIPTMAKWVSECQGKPVSVMTVTRFLNTKPLKCLVHGKDEVRRFWQWNGPQADTATLPVEMSSPLPF